MEAEGGVMVRYSEPVAILATAFILAMPGPVRAECLFYDAPDICTMKDIAPEGFWIGVYDTRHLHGVMSVNGTPRVVPPSAEGDSVIAEFDGDLVIQHPKRMLNGTLVEHRSGVDDWDWDFVEAEIDLPTVDDASTMSGCDMPDLPRWEATTHSDDGHEMTLELVAVTPFQIRGRLHGSAVLAGGSMAVEQMIVFERSTFPLEGLEPTVLSSEACDRACADSPFKCPARE